jgi:hypothetical protein
MVGELFHDVPQAHATAMRLTHLGLSEPVPCLSE